MPERRIPRTLSSSTFQRRAALTLSMVAFFEAIVLWNATGLAEAIRLPYHHLHLWSVWFIVVYFMMLAWAITPTSKMRYWAGAMWTSAWLVRGVALLWASEFEDAFKTQQTAAVSGFLAFTAVGITSTILFLVLPKADDGDGDIQHGL